MRNLLFFTLIGFASTLWAANSQSVDKNWATLQQGSGTSVYWDINPNVYFDSIKLTLRSGDLYLTFKSDGAPSTTSLDDGSYQYELVVTPSLGPLVTSELKAARSAADGQENAVAARSLTSQGRTPSKRQIQSGHFTISDGLLVSAEETE